MPFAALLARKDPCSLECTTHHHPPPPLTTTHHHSPSIAHPTSHQVRPSKRTPSFKRRRPSGTTTGQECSRSAPSGFAVAKWRRACPHIVFRPSRLSTGQQDRRLETALGESSTRKGKGPLSMMLRTRHNSRRKRCPCSGSLELFTYRFQGMPLEAT